MSLKRLLPWALLLGMAVLAGCIFSPAKDPPIDTRRTYSESLSAPDSLLNDLQAAYERREIEPYARLLGQDFKFVFAQDDVTPDIPLGYWNAEEDSTGTRKLFESVQVNQIRITLTWFPPTDETLDGLPTKRVIVSNTSLDVDQSNGITLRVDGDQQYFYFRLGRAELGQDTTRYYMVQWEDLGTGGGEVGAPSGDRLEPASTDGNVVHVSMSQLMRSFIAR